MVELSQPIEEERTVKPFVVLFGLMYNSVGLSSGLGKTTLTKYILKYV